VTECYAIDEKQNILIGVSARQLLVVINQSYCSAVKTELHK